MTQRFCTILGLPRHRLPARRHARPAAAARPHRPDPVGGIDLNKQRIRGALAAVLALSAAPGGFTVAELAAKVQVMGGQSGYTIRQAADDLRKLRGTDLLVKPGRSRRYQVPSLAARAIAALLALRDQVIGPILAGVRSPDWAASPPAGPPSTATTRPCASVCRPSSPTSASLLVARQS